MVMWVLYRHTDGMSCNWLGGIRSCGVSISYNRQSRGSAPDVKSIKYEKQ